MQLPLQLKNLEAFIEGDQCQGFVFSLVGLKKTAVPSLTPLETLLGFKDVYSEV